MEKERKRLNVVITGLEREMVGNKVKIEEWMKKNLEIEIELEEVWTIGKEKKLIAKCKRRGDKERIMENKRKLKGVTVIYRQ